MSHIFIRTRVDDGVERWWWWGGGEVQVESGKSVGRLDFIGAGRTIGTGYSKVMTSFRFISRAKPRSARSLVNESNSAYVLS